MLRFTTHEFAKALREPLFHVKNQMRSGTVAGIDVREHGIRDDSGRLIGVEVPDAAAKRLRIEAPASSQPLPEPSHAEQMPVRTNARTTSDEPTEPAFEVIGHGPSAEPTDAEITAIAEHDPASAVAMYERKSEKKRRRQAKGWMLLGGIVAAGLLLPTVMSRKDR
jgi:hypothetical protein